MSANVPSPAVAVEVIGLRIVVPRSRIVAAAADGRRAVVLVGEIDVIGDEQVERAIAVDVQEIGARAEEVAPADAGAGRHVGERSVAVVVVQDVGAEVIAVQVGLSIVVVVADGHAHPVARIAHAGRLRRVRESESVQVAVQGILGGALDRSAPQRPAVQEVDVDQPVAVEVKGGQTRGNRLGNVVPPAAAVGVSEGDPGLLGDIAENNRSLGLCLGRKD